LQHWLGRDSGGENDQPRPQWRDQRRLIVLMLSAAPDIAEATEATDGGPPPRLRQEPRNRPQPPAISAAPSPIIHWRRSRFIRVLFPRGCCPPAPIPFRWSRPALARQEQGGSFLRHSRGKANSLVGRPEIQRARNERKVRDVDVVVWSGVCLSAPRAKSVINWRGGPDAALAAAA
jgi:hypothetical protein